MDENPNLTLAETYDKIGMRETFLSEGKQRGSLVENFSFAAHTACATFVFVCLIAISILGVFDWVLCAIQIIVRSAFSEEKV